MTTTNTLAIEHENTILNLNNITKVVLDYQRVAFYRTESEEIEYFNFNTEAEAADFYKWVSELMNTKKFVSQPSRYI